MPDRLTALKRQRALVAEHLLWLDQEIAALSGASPSPRAPADSPPSPQRPSLAISPQALPGVTPSAPRPDPLLAQLQQQERKRGHFSKSGCWVIFSILMSIGILGVAALIIFRYR